MPRPMIGTAGMPWLVQHALCFEETVRVHGACRPGPLLASNAKHSRARIAERANVSPAYVERLSWYEFNPTTGSSGTREVSKVRAVLAEMGWPLEDWLWAADEMAKP